jgi:DNA-binding transcriptional regulator/RsmH inhibitor MraZ
LVSYADINTKCVIIGANDRLEIWSEENWIQNSIDNENVLEDIAENLFNGGDSNETL